ncbi:LacI family DNA-binding transcriptional regulator [Paradesertivirga mongoliensis]|uniref:LacI family DNA-binding transcriptional regulator n=1 Tax=Paradesertivirga mongoliensis TaxID=2100740 RepID=A0ABW4ZK58_9SPHI|nr:LacI family DNA-binding transcriptional regulator [Pedobacter mongoliensis]
MIPEKEITIYDIAKSLNISAATVSRGLKDHPGISKLTKKRIFDAAKDMGYRFNSLASNLRRQRTNTIGVIVPRLNSSFMSDAIAGMEQVANQAGYNLIISQSLETVKKEVENSLTMFNNRVDGLLVSLAYNTQDISHFEAFIKKGIPVIFFDRIFEHIKCPNIIIDNYQAGYEITKHLIAEGGRRIMHVSGNQSRNVYSERFRGYRDALEEFNLPFSDELLIVNNLTALEGIETAVQILSMEKKPEAVFVSNDTCAVACMLELKKQGIKIPEDISFAGFNNDPIAKVVEPNLTTINYHGEEMGELAANILIRHLTNNLEIGPAHTTVLGHELIVRQSSTKKII